MQEALRVVEAAAGPEDPDLVLILGDIASQDNQLGRFAEARPLFERALVIQEKQFGSDHPALAFLLNNLAYTYSGLGDHERARALFERALAIREHAFGPDSPAVVATLNDLGLERYNLGDYEAAQSLMERALQIVERKRAPEDDELVSRMWRLANVYYSEGDYERARPLYERCLEIKARLHGSTSINYAGALGGLVLLDEAQGDLAAALASSDLALSILDSAHTAPPPTLASALLNRANILRETGDLRSARPLYDRAITLLDRPEFPAQRNMLSGALTNQASLLYELGDTTGSARLTDRALARDREAWGDESINVGFDLQLKAIMARDRHRDALADTLFTRALDILHRTVGPENPDVADVLDNQADLFRRTGRFDSARAAYEEALAIRQKTLGPDSPATIETQIGLATLEIAQGNRQTAIAQASHAEAASRDQFRATTRVMPQRLALEYAAVRGSAIDVLLSAVDSTSTSEARRSALDAIVRSRALVLDEMVARNRALLAAANSATDTTLAAYRSAASRYAHAVVQGPGSGSVEQYRSRLERLRAELENKQTQLAARSVELRNGVELHDIGIKQVVAALPPASTLLGYFAYHAVSIGTGERGPLHYFAYVVGPQSDSVAVHDLGAAATVDSLIAVWNEASGPLGAQNPHWRLERDYLLPGKALRRRIWDPVAPLLRGAKLVLIVPDGRLNLVSFAALPLDTGAYELESGPAIQYLSAERDVASRGPGRSAGSGLLALGGVEFDQLPDSSAVATPALAPESAVSRLSYAQPMELRGGSAGCSLLAGVHFSRLPATLKEVRDVEETWRGLMSRAAAAGGSTAQLLSAPSLELSGALATEREFKEHAAGQAVLHLATHGFFIGNRCATRAGGGERGVGGLGPAVALGARPAVVDATDGLAGLALAGANTRDRSASRDDDGILTADEIGCLDLSACQWAVLSACESGVGDLRNGEGILGLRRAFQVSGARTLITSLCAVDDLATQQWMHVLYDAHFGQGLSTPESVRAASLSVLHGRRARAESTRPFYWGAFVAAGSWN